MKEFAEQILGEKVDRAVISVPAQFDDRQRSATRMAGELAGLKVERLINEPTAAALAFGVEDTNEGQILVYDLGGGTFDVSILNHENGVYEVLISRGDNHLGGEDFDHELAVYVANQFKSETGIDLKDDKSAMTRIQMACKKAKERLSFEYEVTVAVPYIASHEGKPESLSLDVSRNDFEKLIEPFLDRAESLVVKALAEAAINADDIDSILLVGGSTRIPRVRQLVQERFKKEPRVGIDPDRAVALGASIQAAIIDGESDQVILDRSSLAYGTNVIATIGGQMVDGVFDEILPADTPYLTRLEQPYRTTHDNQDAVDIEVYEKASNIDSIWCRDHTLLHREPIEGLAPMPAGLEGIGLSYTLTPDGSLNVEATINSSGEKKTWSVETHHRSAIDAEDLDKLWEQSEKASKVKATIRTAEKKLKEVGDHAQLEEKISQLKAAVVSDDDVLIDKLDEELTDIVFELS